MTKIKEHDIFITTTDTVLGIGGKVNDINKEKIYKIKKRDYTKPLIIVIGSLEQLKSFFYLYDYFDKLYDRLVLLK